VASGRATKAVARQGKIGARAKHEVLTGDRSVQGNIDGLRQVKGKDAARAGRLTAITRLHSVEDEGESEMRKEVLAIMMAAALLAGCVSVGTKVDPSVVATFQPGVTTIQDAESKLGPPNSTTNDSEGGTTIMYVYSHAQASGSSYIPVVGAFVGHTDSNTVTSTLMFDKNGKYLRSTTSQGQMAAGMINHS
jgi:hypothetical protein